MVERVEVVIVGGGLAGLPLALALARAGVPVAVIDREVPSTMLDPAFDGRSTALALGAQRLLAAVGVWPHLAAHAEPIRDIRVIDGDAPLFLHYDHRAVGDEPFGWVFENRALRHALFQAVAGVPNLVHRAPAAVARVEREAEGVTAHLVGGETIRARLAVAADGRGSGLRQSAGINLIEADYGQTAITCTIAHERPHHGVAIERFLPGGPFAILPMVGQRSSIVWSERSDLVPGILARDPGAFDRDLQDRVGDWLGAVRAEGPRWTFPLKLMLATRVAAPRLALVGEAGHVIHPIAGQGLNLGLRDVAALAELIVDACRLGLDPGGPAVLARYERWRRTDTVGLALVTDGLNRLFSNRILPLRVARTLGLAAVERLPPLKRLFMRHAMGVLGDLPRLAKGERL